MHWNSAMPFGKAFCDILVRGQSSPFRSRPSAATPRLSGQAGSQALLRSIPLLDQVHHRVG